MADAVNAARQNIQSIVGSFITNAANVDTQLGLRAAAMDQSDMRINAVYQLWVNGLQAKGTLKQDPGTNALGQAVQKPEVTAMTAPDTSSTTGVFGAQVARYCGSGGCGGQNAVGGLDGQANAALKLIESAMGASDPSVYESARDTIVVPYVHSELAWGATLMSNVQNADVASTRNDIAAQTGALLHTDDGSSYFAAIKAKWKCNGTHTGACSTTPAPWYCK